MRLQTNEIACFILFRQRLFLFLTAMDETCEKQQNQGWLCSKPLQAVAMESSPEGFRGGLGGCPVSWAHIAGRGGGFS
jgi:hypothetical protein